jgi:signal transduction histidine kinase
VELAGRSPEELIGQPALALGQGEPWATAAATADLARARRAPAAAQAHDTASGRTWDVSANLAPEGDGSGGERVIVVARDITHVLELQESVRREERMAAMGSLVAGVAHEVRNPLFGISSTLDAFEARHGEGEAFKKYLTLLRRETERLSALMRDLLDYGRPPVLDMAAADFATVVDESVQLCQAQAGPAGVRVVRAGAPPQGRVRLDRWRMQQALQNVIQNAIQHSPPGGTVTVTVGESDDGERRHVFCSVRDAGPGFQPEDLPHLFEPFFTRRKGGTGMGLSLAQRILLQHGGRLQARNHPEGGAVMTLTLPAEPVAEAAAV